MRNVPAAYASGSKRTGGPVADAGIYKLGHRPPVLTVALTTVTTNWS